LLLLAGCAQTPAPTATGLEEAVAVNARALFQHYDVNGDAKLDAFEAARIALSGQPFQALDRDHDGGLSWEEFGTPVRIAGLARGFADVASDLVAAEDADGDGRLSRLEYRTGLLVPAAGPMVANPLADPLEASFDSADADGDGNLTPDEANRLIGFLLRSGYHLQQRLR
jgi:hypothetical protein